MYRKNQYLNKIKMMNFLFQYKKRIKKINKIKRIWLYLSNKLRKLNMILLNKLKVKQIHKNKLNNNNNNNKQKKFKNKMNGNR